MRCLYVIIVIMLVVAEEGSEVRPQYLIMLVVAEESEEGGEVRPRYRPLRSASMRETSYSRSIRRRYWVIINRLIEFSIIRDQSQLFEIR